ncbi:MAG: SdrD B-like domain-containing protein [Candidatus Gracilibacteria bacterium]|nr:SdrD B-like domain-containing protein [Candidatus Gracilibacteria bacterium]
MTINGLKFLQGKKLFILLILITIILVLLVGFYKYNLSKTNIQNVNTEDIQGEGETDTSNLVESNIESNTGIINNEINIQQKEEVNNTKEILTESEKEKIDEYNFEQLEIVKSKLDNLPKDSYTLNNYLDFNKKFDEKLKPINNCYYLKTGNGKNPYIFGFKLESDKYITNYGTGFYSYPSYDLPIDNICFGFCRDRNYEIFTNIISSTCGKYLSGYIYDDENKNGIMDIGEKGVEGVVLLIGVDFILTDEDGYFSFGDLSLQKFEMQIKRLPDGYGLIKRNTYIYKVEFGEGENLKNINIGLEKKG